MSRIDWLMLKRFAGRIGMVLIVCYGFMIMIETFDIGRFQRLNSLFGLGAAVFSLMASAARWTLKALPIVVLLGSLLALIDLQGRREIVAAKAAGMSIWRLARAPVLAVFLAGLLTTVGVERLVTEVNRSINPLPPGSTSVFTGSSRVWLSQEGGPGGHYVVQAGGIGPDRTSLTDATFFMTADPGGSRYSAPLAVLEADGWRLPEALQIRTNGAPLALPDFRIGSTMTPPELRLKLGASEDLTFTELAAALASPLADATTRNAIATRFGRMLSLPLLLAGAMLIAFAFTAGYRRTQQYGVAGLFGIVLGFVVFVTTEMADRAGSAGVIDPTFAAWGPAVVAIVIGMTVLLYKEDGRS